MSSGGQHIKHCDISKLEAILLKEGVLQIQPASFFKYRVSRNELLYFMYEYGIYMMPTQEIVEWLKENIIGSAIEIGAGNGAMALALKIPATDSKLQERIDMRMLYNAMDQPVIKYPHFIEKLEAIEAVKKYKPDTVIGAYITAKWRLGMDEGNMFGPDMEEIIKLIKRYIFIGNINTHKTNPIFKRKYRSFPFDWIITRAVDQTKNRIWVFDN